MFNLFPIAEIFPKNKTSRLLTLICALIPCLTIVGFVSVPETIYYAYIIFLFTLNFVRAKEIDYKLVFFLFILVITAAFSSAPPFFKIWQRLGLLICVFCSLTPVFKSSINSLFRIRLFVLFLCLISLICVASFFCYFLGINYMWSFYGTSGFGITAGTFGGLTRQSMVLGFFAAISTIFLTFLSVSGSYSKKTKRILIFCALACEFCVLVSASRASLLMSITGLCVMLYLKNRANLGMTLKYGILIVFALILSYPLYSNYLDFVLQKQEANIEMGGTFASRNDKWSNRLDEFESSPILGIGVGTVDVKHVEDYSIDGVIEPGSSWLAMLSMTGILGTTYFLIITIPMIIRLYRKAKKEPGLSVLTFSLICALFIHMIPEGYIFAGGSPLCFTFWLIFSVAYSLSTSK